MLPSIPSRSPLSLFPNSAPKLSISGMLSHIARVCKIPVRFFRCGGFGHMSRRCSKRMSLRSISISKMSPSSQDSYRGSKAWEDSWTIQDFYSVAPSPKDDPFLLDLDFVRCSGGYSNPVCNNSSLLHTSRLGESTRNSLLYKEASELQMYPCPPDSSDDSTYGASNGARLNSSQVPPEKFPVLNEAPTSKIFPPVVVLVIAEIQGQTCLELNPVPREVFEDIVIIDDFEDDYSDDEEIPLRFCSIPIDEDSFDSVEDLRKDGKAIFMPMDTEKFIIYCHIQAVDGFNRLIRARARGSMIASPFRSKKEIKKSCYIECLRESTNPPRRVAPVSPSISVAAKKKKGDIKPFRGLVIPGSVRRSPRLNKGLIGQSM